MHCSSNKHLVLLAIIALLSTATSLLNASRGVSSRSLKKSSTTSLMSWSLQIPSNFGTFKSTWYNEVDNPTARKTVYEDTPMEFQFVSVGSDWPSINEIQEETSAANDIEARIVINPIRRARRWIARRRA